MTNNIPDMSTEQTEAFMAASPSREEVNQYMNNLFIAVNNNFGLFQGYMINSLATVTTEYLSKAGIEVTAKEFIDRFSEHNGAIIKDAQERMIKAEEEARKTTAPAQSDDTAKKEVDISVL